MSHEPQERTVGITHPRTIREASPSWPARTAPPADSPNVVVVLLDDVGYSQLGCYGSDIDTPCFDRLATRGLRYTDFHTTALCSPSRAALLTGRNPHSVGFGSIVERAAGFAGYNATIPASAATMAAVLRGRGYSTSALGKWHLTPPFETGPGGPFDRWPLGLGFERFYGFLGGSTDQYAPALYADNSRAAPPKTYEDGYHLTEDLADKAITWLSELGAISPAKPYFLYFAPGACHSPHQAPRVWIDRYRGRFDDGWDVARRRTFDRQKRLGIVPPDAVLPPDNPGVVPWDDLGSTQQRVFARMMEVYAGFLSHTDHHIGRLLDHLDAMGDTENTLVFLLSDNGASGDAGANGTWSEGLINNGLQQDFDYLADRLDQLGGPTANNNYPWGWAQAGNTPFRWYKQFTHAGGITDPCIVSWPRRIGDHGSLRRGYHHIIDVMPTILEATGIDAPDIVAGIPQQPVEGVSMAATFDADVASRRLIQHYEMYGNRALWQQGWTAVARLQPDPPGSWPTADMPWTLDDVPWELYGSDDPTQATDLAPTHPEKLQELKDLWWQEAEKYGVLPIDDRHRLQRWNPQPGPPGSNPRHLTFYGLVGPLERGVVPRLAGAAFHITADLQVSATPPGDSADSDRQDAGNAQVGSQGDADSVQGVLLSVGDTHGGYSWYLQGGHVHFEINLMTTTHIFTAPADLAAGQHRLGLTFAPDTDVSGHLTSTLNNQVIGSGYVERLLHVHPFIGGRLQTGADNPPAVSRRYRAPFRLTGANLIRIDVEIEPAEADRHRPTDPGARDDVLAALSEE